MNKRGVAGVNDVTFLQCCSVAKQFGFPSASPNPIPRPAEETRKTTSITNNASITSLLSTSNSDREVSFGKMVIIGCSRMRQSEEVCKLSRL